MKLVDWLSAFLFIQYVIIFGIKKINCDVFCFVLYVL